jgi:hypothetical protein
MSKYILLTLLISLASLSLKAQKDTVFQRAAYDIGNIKLNSQNAYFSSFSVLVGEELKRYRLKEVDSLTMNGARYLTLGFNIGNNQYQSISKRYFKGSYELYVTWSDQHGELQLLKTNDTVRIINEQNKSMLFDFNRTDLQASNVKMTSKSLTKMAEKMHTLNGQSFVKYRKQKGSGLVKQLHIGLRIANTNKSWDQSFNDQIFEDKLTDSSIDIIARAEGRFLFFEPSLKIINTTYNMDSVFFEDVPKFNITRERRGVVLSTDFGLYILKNPFFRPFIKVGLSFPMATKYSINYVTANNSIDNYSYILNYGNLKYGPSFGAGVKTSIKSISAVLSYTIQNVSAKANGEVRYDETSFRGTPAEFTSVKGESFRGDYEEKIGRLELSILIRAFKQ